jgi:hypothetical protein
MARKAIVFDLRGARESSFILLVLERMRIARSCRRRSKISERRSLIDARRAVYRRLRSRIQGFIWVVQWSWRIRAGKLPQSAANWRGSNRFGLSHQFLRHLSHVA